MIDIRTKCITTGLQALLHELLQFDIIICLIKRLPVLLVQIEFKLLPLCSFDFRCYSK
jgi:hypothetical protein